MRTSHFTIVSTAPDGSPHVYRAASRDDWYVRTSEVRMAGHTEICASQFVEYRFWGITWARRYDRYIGTTGE